MIRRKQEGMAALVVTVILISLLSAVAVAFAVVMNRELQKSVDNQLGQAAYNAAASGINDSISFLRDNPNTNVTQCSDLIGTGKPLSAASNLSGDGSTKYTCVLINSRPLDLVYQSIASNQSQVLKTSFSAPAGKIMFSWQATNRAYSNFVPAAQAGQLFDETAWYAAKYAPMLKVSLYPIPADTQDAGYALSNSKTYYLYPQKPVGFSVNTLSYATQAGTLVPVECGLKNLNGAFNGTPDYDCSLIINNLPSSNPAGYMYYVRLTPIYGAADVKIRANDTTGSSTPVNFLSTQAIVDVTAKSASAVKRLQARVDISGINGTSQNISSTDNAFPEYALRSANTVCKRLYNTGTIDLPAYIDAITINYCGADLSGFQKLSPPVVSVNCSATGETTASCSGTVNPNNGKITACTLTNSDGKSTTCATNPSPSSAPYGVSWDITGLTASTTYTVTLCATNPAGPGCNTSPSYTTFSPPPPPPPAPPFLSSFSQDTNCVYGGVRHGNCYNFTGSNLAPWPCTYTIDGGTGNGYSLNADGTAGSFTYGNDGVVAGSGNITCGSASCALNSTDCTNVPPAPGTIFISSFLVQGPYDNGPSKTGRFCPEVFGGTHRYVVCMTWSSNSSNAGEVYCTAYFAAPDGTTRNSNPLLPNSGWTVGSDNPGDLIGSGSSYLICRGYTPGDPVNVFAHPNGITDQAGGSSSNHDPSCGSRDCAGPYFYRTPNCLQAISFCKVQL